MGGVAPPGAPGGPFHDLEADAALLEAIIGGMRQTMRRRVARIKANIYDAQVVDADLTDFASITPELERRA